MDTQRKEAVPNCQSEDLPLSSRTSSGGNLTGTGAVASDPQLVQQNVKILTMKMDDYKQIM